MNTKPLVELDPLWVIAGDEATSTAQRSAQEIQDEHEGAEPIGVTFTCPACMDKKGYGHRVGVMFKNCPSDRNYILNKPTWTRHDRGLDLKTLHFVPSLDATGNGQCKFHGWVGREGPGIVSWP